MKLEGTSTLITGGSRGLGRSLARSLARRGARVVLVARDAEALERAAQEIRASGGEAHAVAADLAEPGAASRIAGAAAAMVGGIDLVIHDASTLGSVPLRPIAETSHDDFDAALALNVRAPFQLTKATVGGMVGRGHGLVVAISSDAAVSAYPDWGAYGATKAALDHLMRILDAELDGTGVRAVSVDPGEMDTAMHAAALPSADPAALAQPDDVAERIVTWIARGAPASDGRRIEASALVMDGGTP